MQDIACRNSGTDVKYLRGQLGEQQVTDDIKLRNRWEIAFTERRQIGDS
jgi:hypothetical protein